MLSTKERYSPSVRIMDTWEKSADRYAPGAFIEVRNGLGKLHKVYGTTDNATYITLMLEDQPLFQLQGNEIYCPTCEKIVRSGYGFAQTAEFKGTILNGDFTHVTIPQAIKGIEAILKLLTSGCYVVLDTELYPTDGYGYLFCNAPNNASYHISSHNYRPSDPPGIPRPYFTLATEPQSKIQQSRVEHYMENPRGRALAYYMDGDMTALLDGHHKAMAAAMLHEKVNALLIVPCNRIGNYNTEHESIGIDGFQWDCAEFGLTRSSIPRGTEVAGQVLSKIINCSPDRSKYLEYNGYAHYYPTIYDLDRLSQIGEITDQRITDILCSKEVLDEEDAAYAVRAIISSRPERALEVVDFLLKQDMYHSQRYDILWELFKLEKSDQLTDFLIAMLLKCEWYDPEIKDLIVDLL